MSAIMAGSFCRNWIFAIMIMEIPRYFKDAYKLNIASVSKIQNTPIILQNYHTLSILYVYLFQRESYFSRISTELSALIHEYANMFDSNEYYIEKEADALLHHYANKYSQSIFTCFR